MFIFCTIFSLFGVALGLDNGLARTPPMGFLSWERFRCNLDCKNDPHNCISEYLYRSIADSMVSEGYKDLGYEYVSLDDCWMTMSRDSAHRLQADPDRFPSGMHNLSQYIHSKGLKFGIYQNFGSATCAGYPGSEFFMSIDAQTFGEWEVDFLKFDGCYSDPHDMGIGYALMARFLNQTGRPILYSCEWPLYNLVHNLTSNYTAIRETCNFWRNYYDIQDSWHYVKRVIDYYTEDDGNFASSAGPGGFNDPDQLVVGGFGLSYDQQKSQFGMWAMFAAPLFISTDIRNLRPEIKAILQNKRVIAINQDPLGAQGTLLYETRDYYERLVLQVYLKPLAKNGTFAFAILNNDVQGMPTRYTVPLRKLTLTNPGGYNVTEAFDNVHLGYFKADDNITMSINPTGGIFLATAIPVDVDSIKA